MRLLHTGDWHVGRTIRGRSRTDEFERALAEVIAIARDQKVDAILVAGDIYDQRAVSADADRLVFDTLLELHAAGIPVIAIPGNHDSVVRLEAFARLLSHVGTTLVPRVRRPDQGALVEVPAKDGAHAAKIACVPFVSPRRFSDAAAEFADLATGFVNFDDNMGKLLAAYEKQFSPEHVNVVLGHMFISGSQPGGSEREVTIGTEYAVSPTRLPGTASYVALGHIHKPQKIKGAPCDARYAGSLLQLDFGEKGQEKSVVVVDVVPGKPPKSTEIPIDAGRRLVDLEGTLDDLEKLAATVGDAYLRVSIHVDQPVPGIADRIRDALPNALDVRLVLPESEGEAAAPVLRGLDPRSQFIAYYLSAHSVEPVDALVDAFDRVHDEVTA